MSRLLRASKLRAAARNAAIEIIGIDDIKNEAQGEVVMAFLRAFGSSDVGFIYVEPRLARSLDRPPDVLLCHPDVGLLFVEVKGHSITEIEGLKAGKLIVKQGGQRRPVDPIRQAESAQFDVKNALESTLNGGPLPLFNIMVAFPNITADVWHRSGYHEAYPSHNLLFRSTLLDSDILRLQVQTLVGSNLAKSRKQQPLTNEQITAIKRIFGDTAVINDYSRHRRDGLRIDSLGTKFDDVALMEKYLSPEQQELSRLYVNGYPRLIRGVAGSGKSVVLANLVARYANRWLHQTMGMYFMESAQPLHIGVVCFNRSLVPMLQQKIQTAYRQQTLEDLPDGVVQVTHFNGIFYEWGRQRQLIDYLSPYAEQDSVTRAKFYHQQLPRLAQRDPDLFQSMLYDAIFVDEGQDFAPEEYQLLLDLMRADPITGEKTLVIFYDDAQNLYGHSRPNWKQIGLDVQRGDRARVMKECFRNTREIVELAFNVLLGTQSEDGRQVQTRTFADVKYLKQQGLVEEHNGYFGVKFAERRFQKPIVKAFSTREQEKQWIATEVKRLITEEEVRPDDILVLFGHSGEFGDLDDYIAQCLGNRQRIGFLKPYGQNHADKDQYIFREGHLTISTTHGAKGYDAYVVFLVGVDLFDLNERDRASFYVGATRAKMVLYVSGVQRSPSLLEEAHKINELNNYYRRLTQE